MSNGKLLIINGPGLSDLSDHNEVANDDLSLSVIEQKCIETSGNLVSKWIFVKMMMNLSF